MKARGHLGFGFLLLTPIVLNQHLPTFDICNYTIINLINNKIVEINNFIIQISTIININNINLDNFIFIAMLFIIFFVGTRIPDLDLIFENHFGYENSKRFKYHRQITHSLLLTLLIMFSGNIFLFMLGYGILTHLIGDMLTGSIPIFISGNYYPSLNFLKWRIGIDSLYIFLPTSNLKNNIKAYIFDIKKFIVKKSDKFSSFFIKLFILIFFIKLFI